MDKLTDYLYDIIQNSIQAKSHKITLSIHHLDKLKITLTDDGCGMDKETLEKVVSAFYTTRTTRKVGLGLSMIKMLCEQTEGSFLIESSLGIGTSIYMTFNDTHIDMPPLGDFGDLIYDILLHQDIIGFIFSYHAHQGTFVLDVKDMRETFDQTLRDTDIKLGLKAWINHEIEEKRGRQ